MKTLQDFYAELEKIYHLRSISSLLHWDQQVCMPSGAVPTRTKQVSFLAEEIHNRFTAPHFVDLVLRLSETEKKMPHVVNLREVRREQEKQQKLPVELVAKRSRLASESFHAWQAAREKSDFRAVQPLLESLVKVVQEESEHYGYESNPYDPHIDAYEAYSRYDDIRDILLRLAASMKEHVGKATEKSKAIQPLRGDFPIADQKTLNSTILTAIGFPSDCSRVDVASHPFMSLIGKNDARVTTRYQTDDFLSSLLTLLHEVGHAFYELGFKSEYEGTPMALAVSMGIHESQSLYWENFVGRSPAFCDYLYARLPDHFRKHATSPEQMCRILNRVEPSLIRVEADRFTYPLHIVIRMLLEERLIRGTLSVKDLPEAWRALYEEYLGITPTDHKNGVMQDVHWYSGYFGYFPSYALGQIYAAMFQEKLLFDIPNFEKRMRTGDFGAILTWFRTHVHEHGMRYTAKELVTQVCGKAPTEEPLVKHLLGTLEV